MPDEGGTNGDSHCRVCGSATDRVLDLGDVPVGSCVLLADADAAVAYPTGPLVLEFCPACGFIQNGRFDETLVDYAGGYEESQAASPTFLRYVDRLADELDGRHRLSGRSPAATILEPGCGKGEFLVRMCERLGCRGLGIDPAHVPDRVTTSADVTFVREPFTETSEVTGDLVVCRHTLEHISDVTGFLGALRIAAERTEGASVVVEVPESRRILDEGAFWDVYYEHASYFTESSLAEAARRSGLDPRRIDLMYADQYLILDAVPAVPGVVPGGPAADGAPEELVEAVRRFAGTVTGRIADWRRIIASAERTVLWGASSKAVGFLSGVGSDGVELAVDINPHKHGSYLAGSGVRICAPDELVAHDPDLVIVMNPVYRDEIAEMLVGLGLRPRIEVCG